MVAAIHPAYESDAALFVWPCSAGNQRVIVCRA